jgi:predicted nucleotidyltransferase
MKVAGLITEYNPFHNGHRIHIEKTRELTGATHLLAVMSGSFVQRGEPALVDKWTRAQMAVENGVDLVVELPFPYAVQTAELFASGATRILDEIGITDYLVFGSESGKIQELKDIAVILADEPKQFKDYLRGHLNKGNSFSASRSLALKDFVISTGLDLPNTSEILKESNNILGIEYLKSLKKLNSTIIPFTFQRQGDDYKERKIRSNIASATAIRQSIKANDIESVNGLLPDSSYRGIQGFIQKYGRVNGLENYSQVINYLLCVSSPERIAEYFDVEVGLENRIKRTAESASDVFELIRLTATKRYTETRIQRLLVHMLANMDKEDIIQTYSNTPGYVRILASNHRGFQIISSIRNNSDIEVINKLTDSIPRLKPVQRNMLKLDILATDLYFLGLNPKRPLRNLDFKISPYIHK